MLDVQQPAIVDRGKAQKKLLAPVRRTSGDLMGEGDHLRRGLGTRDGGATREAAWNRWEEVAAEQG
jgi:hypothetical protein